MTRRIEPGMLCRINELAAHSQNVGGIVTAMERMTMLGMVVRSVRAEGRALVNGLSPCTRTGWCAEVALTPITPPASDKATDTPASRDLLERMRQSACNRAALRMAGFPVLVD